MGDKIRIGVIFGGRSGEHEVSLMSARSLLSVLDPQKYTVTQIGITHTGAWVTGEAVLDALQNGRSGELQPAAILPDPARPGLYAVSPSQSGNALKLLSQLDVVFPVLHGTFGEDGTLQGLLELADLAYVGAGVLGSSVGMDKALFKDVMRAHGIPVPESMTVTRRQVEASMEQVLDQVETLAGYPYFVKPANLGSSVGVSKVRSRSDLYEGILDAARYDRRILIEQGINGREIEVSVLGNEDPVASLPGEEIPSDDFYSYRAKYVDDRSELIIPARVPETVSAALQDYALRVFKAIDCAGMARVDFLLEKDSDAIFVSEINTIPGFTRISMYPKLWQASGIGYPELVDRLIELALERKAERDHTERQYGREK
jgi:D-alanine-D-alanine ligase